MKILKIIKILRFSLKVPILGTLTPDGDVTRAMEWIATRKTGLTRCEDGNR
jgi:hypothetical protein